jgi:hypothetical protein
MSQATAALRAIHAVWHKRTHTLSVSGMVAQTLRMDATGQENAVIAVLASAAGY